ncbi:MAG: glycoside hydrolase family 2 [Anaerolineae bacterium]|jgi:beta-galactosidase/beta-glucuronidase|nr:glycoside hydrolase family 2 [Anaerolineae bacterium]
MHEVIHPRPQLTRKAWSDLNGVWHFAFDDANVGIEQGWVMRPEVFDTEIHVPFPPESQASGIGDTGFHPVVWYRRVIQVPLEARHGHVLLHFGAVDYIAQVWVNGQLVVTHQGGHTPFFADIRPALLSDREEQVIVVRAEDQPMDLAQPRGKQFWEEKPRDIWYTRTTGIWQQVWLETVGHTYIASVRWTPDLDQQRLGMHIKLNQRPTKPITLQVRITLHDQLVADDRYQVYDQEFRRDLWLDTRNLNWRKVIWSPDYPNLAEIMLTLYEGDRVIDEAHSYAGLRSVGIGNGFFLLNGSPIYLRLVLAQGYWPDTNLTPPTLDALREEVELIKALGFNGVRIHQKIEDPRFLYWCDKLGVLVWGEMANAHHFSTEAVQRLTREWMEVIERDYNHPSIICWVPLNESWGVPHLARNRAQQSYVQALYHLTHALDDTRPVIGNDGWEHIASDVWGIHDYAIDGDALRERYGTIEAVEQTIQLRQPQFRLLSLPGYSRTEEPVMLTEFGGIAFAPNPGEPWFGYGTVNDLDQFLHKYEELVSAVLDSPSIVGFCYTQLTDVQQETNGLLTADRKPKLSIEQIYRITARPSRALPNEILNYIHQAAEALTQNTD